MARPASPRAVRERIERMKATLHTNHGPIDVELFPDEVAPTVTDEAPPSRAASARR